jgi:hypothetical protein
MTNNTKDLLINDFIVDLDFYEEDAVERVNDMYDQIKYDLVEKIEALLQSRKDADYNMDHIDGMRVVLDLVKGYND